MADPVTGADAPAQTGLDGGAGPEGAAGAEGGVGAEGEVGVEVEASAPGVDPVETPAERAAPIARAPDPAGTRPKVTSASLEPAEPLPAVPGAPRGSASLGQTFRTPPAPGLLPGSPRAGSTGAIAASAGPADDGGGAGGGGGDGDGVERVESPHAPRFQFILGALLALGLSAIAITAYTLGSGRDPIPTDWSAWHPTAVGYDGAGQIGNHVAAEYRQPGTGQLLAVKGGPLALAGVPMTIALRNGPAATGGVNVLTGNAVLYKMCGLGPGCSITGKASSQRLMLVRREALELALYTFKYVGGADQVVVFLPPVLRPSAVPGQPKKVKVTTDPTDAVFFRSTDLAGELSHPLEQTLTATTPSLATVDQAPDTSLVTQLTSPSFYKFSFVPSSQDASLFLVLDPLAVS
jgi:hypothetical protein